MPFEEVRCSIRSVRCFVPRPGARGVKRLKKNGQERPHVDRTSVQLEKPVRTMLVIFAAMLALIAFGQETAPVADWTQALVYDAAFRGNIQLVSQAVTMGRIHPDAKGPAGVSLLAAAASGGQIQIAKFLIENGADPMAPQNAIALPLAAANGDLPMVKYLVESGMPVNLPKNAGHYEPALLAAMRDNGQEVALYLIAHGAESKGPNIFGMTALTLASSWGNIGVVESLLAHGADVNERDSYGKTPLMSACAKKQKAVVRLLLSMGADPCLIDGYDRCATTFLANDSDDELREMCGCGTGNGRPNPK